MYNPYFDKAKRSMTPNERQNMIETFRQLLQVKSSTDLRSIHDYPWYPGDIAHCLRLAAVTLASDGIELFDPEDGMFQFCLIEPEYH